MPEDPWQPKLDQYLDNELPAEETRALEAHLRECPSCAADALHRLQLKRATHFAGKRYTPIADFRRRIEQQVAAKARPRRRWLSVPAFALAAVVLLAALVTAGRWYERSRSERILGELADLHVADLASPSPVDVASSDRHTVKPWFQGRLPFTFDLPELQGTGFTLVGGRVTYLQHEPGAQLLFNMGAHKLSVFIFRDRPEIERAFYLRTSSGRVLSFQVESWAKNGLRYFVFGDASPEAIHQLSTLLQQAAA
jgi:anti-sigma factor RsiW